MKKYSLLFTALSCMTYGMAQTTSLPMEVAEGQRLTIVDVSQKYAETIDTDDLRRHLIEISSDAYEGRETGSAGQKKCEQYMVDFYRSVGIPPVEGSYLQEYEVSINDPQNVELKVAGVTYDFIEDYYYYPGTGDRQLSGEIVWGGYGIRSKAYSDIPSESYDGKVIMVMAGEPIDSKGKSVITGTEQVSTWSTSLDAKREMVEGMGASALIVIKADYDERKERLREYFSHKGMSLVQPDGAVDMSMPVLHISESVARRMLGVKVYEKAKKKTLKQRSKAVNGPTAEMSFATRSEILTTSNVMAYIEGSDKKEEVIVISAHYDHIGVEGELVYNGADDDGSGTVTCMEIAEAFAIAKKEGHGPRRSILILNVSGEERGLLGSQYYAENPVFPLENTVADLNIDMIGRVDEFHPNDSNYVYLIGSDFISQDLHDINVEVSNAQSGLKLDMRYNSVDDPNRFYFRSDHYNFAKHGVPSVFYFTGVHEDYHKPTDTVDKIMFVKMTDIARHIFYTAWDIANREERLRVRP